MSERSAWAPPAIGHAALRAAGPHRTVAAGYRGRARAPIGPLAPATDATAPNTIHAAALTPAGQGFWTRRGSGHVVLVRIAQAHIIAGVCGVLVGMLVWYFLAPAVLIPVVAGGVALVVIVAGALAFELASAAHPLLVISARLLLVTVDLLACGVVLWLMGAASFAPLLFIIPVLMGIVLFAERIALVCAAASVNTFVGVELLRDGLGAHEIAARLARASAWGPQALALAVLAVFIIACCSAWVRGMTQGVALLLRRSDVLRGQRDALRTEQRRLIETLHLLEDAQGRLQAEQGMIGRQLGEIAHVAERLSAGDPSAVRGLRPGAFGPLGALCAALALWGRQLATAHEQQHTEHAQYQVIEQLATASREQTHLLVATDAVLRDLSASANDLATEVQRIERGTGELPGTDRPALLQALRGVEQHALAQASDIAMLGARLAQLRARHDEIEQAVQGRARPALAAAVTDVPQVVSAAAGRWSAAAWGVSGPRASR